MIPSFSKNKEVTDIKYFTPNNVNNYNGYGNCFYCKIKNKVHVHIGISTTSKSDVLIYTLPENYRPPVPISAIGSGSSLTNYSALQINNITGDITVNAQSGYALIDVEFYTL